MLVGERETCKVTDFGMARDVQQDNIYEKKTKVTNIRIKYRLKISCVIRSQGLKLAALVSTILNSIGIVLSPVFCFILKSVNNEHPKSLRNSF